MSEQLVDLYNKVAALEQAVSYLQETALGEHVILDYVLMTESAKPPTKKRPEDAGWDIYSDEDFVLEYGVPTKISTGLKLGFPAFHHGFIWDRSSLAERGIHILGGLIDNPYTGEIGVVVINLNKNDVRQEFVKGSKITQIVVVKLPISHKREKFELQATSRSELGFGSSGLF
jgi:dUTP pyrophosphatase